VEWKNGVNVALHNYFLSIIIILKRDRLPTFPGAQGRKSCLVLEKNNNIKKDGAFEHLVTEGGKLSMVRQPPSMLRADAMLGTKKHTIRRAGRGVNW